MVAVFVHERVGDLGVATGRNDDATSATVAAVAAAGSGATVSDELVGRNDANGDVADLVAVRRLPQEVRVPLRVDTFRPDVEGNRAALVVLERHPACGRRADEHERSQRACHCGRGPWGAPTADVSVTDTAELHVADCTASVFAKCKHRVKHP